MKSSGTSVWHRHVYFLGGFDPKGAAHYYALFKREAQKQSAVNGMSIRVGPREREVNGNSFWKIETEMPDSRYCETTYEFVRWDDLVRKHWQRSVWRLIIDTVWTYAGILKIGAIPDISRMSWKPLVGLLFPLFLWGISLIVGFGAGLGVFEMLQRNGVSLVAASAASTSFLLSAMCVAVWIESRLNTSLLLRIFTFVSKHANGQLPEIEVRLDAAAKRLKTNLVMKNIDEILLVGFSVGSILAVSMMARAIRGVREDLDFFHPTLSLLTLGNCIPAMSLWPQAAGFREELGQLATNKNLRWMDYSSPTDWGSFAMIDPVAACNVSLTSTEQINPEMRSPRFHTMFAPADYKNLRRDKRRMHMQYLMASQLRAEYDFFAISVGGQRLGEPTAFR